VNIKGESFRLKEKRKAGVLTGIKEEPSRAREEEGTEAAAESSSLELAAATSST